jgi:glycopeptide antibiotics resistance protein
LETKLPINAMIDAKAAKRLRWAGHLMLGMIIFGSLLPLHWSLSAAARWPLLLSWRDMLLPDFLQNVAAFGPVGVVYGASREKAAVWRSAALAVMVAIALQIVQLWLPDRTPRLTDAVANSIGLFAGLGFSRATHALRRIASAPLPVEIAILLLLLCHVLLILLIARGAGGIMDQWLVNAGNDAESRLLPAAKMLVAGFAVRAMIVQRSPVVWLYLLFCAACLVTAATRIDLHLAMALLAGGLAAQGLPRKPATLAAIAAIIGIVLWEGLTPWVPVTRDMTWMPLKSMLMNSSLASFVTLSWKLFCWSALALLLCFWQLRGRLIMGLVATMTAMIEITQMHIASGFPDITDILLAAGLSGLVVLVVQQSDSRPGNAPS